MHILIVHAHPEPSSFTSALKNTAVQTLEAAGHTVEVSDLYRENFNPVAGRHDFKLVANPETFHYQMEQEYASETNSFADDLVREQERMSRADVLIFTFPLWWGGVPAILKGWVDRVLAYGFAYVDGYRYDKGFFKGRRGILCLSTGGTKQRFSKDGVYGDIEQVLYPLNHCILKYLGLEVMDPFVAYASPRCTPAEREQYLEDWKNRLLEIVEDRVWQQKLEAIKKTEQKPKIGQRAWERKN